MGSGSKTTDSAPPSVSAQGVGWRRFWVACILGLTLLGLGLLYYDALDDQVIGFVRDDGIYAITAKALAEGQGYKLLHLVSEPNQLKYPILYPLILAVGWWIQPTFPGNFLLLGTLTLSCYLAALGVLFFYLREVKALPGALAWGVVMLVGANYFTIFNATSLMSEGAFLLFSVCALYYAEKKLNGPSPKGKTLFVAALWAALAFHARILGILIVAATALWLAANHSKKTALRYLVPALGLTVLPWGIWQVVGANPMPPEGVIRIDHAFQNYAQEFWLVHSNQDGLKLLADCLGGLVTGLMNLLFPIVPNYFKLYQAQEEALSPGWIRAYLVLVLLFSYGVLGCFVVRLLGKLRAIWKTRSWAPHCSIAGLYVFLYVGVILVWGYEHQVTRFLSVVLPWLWLFLLAPLLPKGQKHTWIRWGVMVGIFGLAMWPAWSGYQHIRRVHLDHNIAQTPRPVLWPEYRDTFRFIQAQVPSHTAIGTIAETTTYLYTGHPTFVTDFLTMPMENGRFTQASFDTLVNSLRYYEVGYLMVEPYLKGFTIEQDENPVAAALVHEYPEAFQRVYQSPQGKISLYAIDLARLPKH